MSTSLLPSSSEIVSVTREAAASVDLVVFSGCQKEECSSGVANFSLSSNFEGAPPQSFDLITTDGLVAGILTVPAGLTTGNSQLNVTFLVSQNQTQTAASAGISSSIVDITLTAEDGSDIKDLDVPLTICLAPSTTEKKTAGRCLGFYDTKAKRWRCEDCSLEKGSSAEGQEDLICGETPHLTSFALLLTGQSGQCASDNQMDQILSWVSLGLVCCAILVVIMGVIAIEIRVRFRNLKLEKRFSVTSTMPIQY